MKLLLLVCTFTHSFRLRGMIEHCMQGWVVGLATGYTDHLRKVKTRLEDQLEKEQNHMAGMNFVLSMIFQLYY